MKLTLKNQSGIDLIWHVQRMGETVGKLIKGRGSKFPWRAYIICPLVSDRLIGSFYDEEGGKKAALACVEEFLNTHEQAYAEYDTEYSTWAVFGLDSGFCYSQPSTEREAKEQASEMNSRGGVLKSKVKTRVS